MNGTLDRFAVRTLSVAVQIALAALAAPVAYAADPAPLDPAVVAQTQPASWAQLGVGYVTDSSRKFGQYNGLFDEGPYAIVDFEIHDATPFNADSAIRWRVVGRDLGLDTRSVTAEYANQGWFRVFVGYDELRTNWTSSYATPFQGVGSNNLTLPSTWIKPVVPQVSATAGNFRGLSPTTGLAPALVNGVLTQPTAAQQAQVNAIQAADLPAFSNTDLDTTRKTLSGGFSYNLGPNWQILVSASQTDQEGLKPLSMINIASGTVATILPNLIDQTTDQYNVALNYSGKEFFFTAAYYGSYFRNHVGSMTWDNAFAPGTSATMSTAPSNEFNQFLLKGGYNFSPTTKLVLAASYGRNTQNQAYLSDPVNLPVGTPVSSLNGEVISTQFTAKLTARPVKDLNVAVGYQFDDRDNNTPVNTYMFYDAGEPKTGTSAFNAALGLPAGTLGSNINIYANRPYSKKVNQFTATADYRVAQGQTINAGYAYQKIDRSCPGSWINCADATSATENTGRIAWDASNGENLSGRLAYSYTQRRVDYDENAFLALVPMANVVPAGVATTISVYDYLRQTGLTGFGPVAGFPGTPNTGDAAVYSPNNNIIPQALYGSRNNINELVGMRRYNMANRDQNKVRASIDWAASERLSVQGNLEYNDDDYSDSVYGLKKSKAFAAAVDASFTVSESVLLHGWYSYEESKLDSAGISYGSNSNTANVNGFTTVEGGCFSTVQARNNNAKIDPCLQWSANQKDVVNTLGAGLVVKGMAAGKLDVGADVVYTDARTKVGVAGGSYANNPLAVTGAPAGTTAVFFIPAANLPDVTSRTIELRLTGVYYIDNRSSLRGLYWWQRLRSSDYAYDGLQFGSLAGIMPTGETSPHYNVSVIGLSYAYKWQ